MRKIDLPLTKELLATLHAGESVLLNGYLYLGRDAVHKKLVALLEENKPLPFVIAGQIIYYCGPSGATPWHPTGAAGPTTSGRMDPFTPFLLAQGLCGMIGKGQRNKEVKEALMTYKAVYFAAIGGAGALYAQKIEQSEIIAFPELGPEALRRILIKDFPVIVANDIYGGDIYQRKEEKKIDL